MPDFSGVQSCLYASCVSYFRFRSVLLPVFVRISSRIIIRVEIIFFLSMELLASLISRCPVAQRERDDYMNPDN